MSLSVLLILFTVMILFSDFLQIKTLLLPLSVLPPFPMTPTHIRMIRVKNSSDFGQVVFSCFLKIMIHKSFVE